ncbi:MAG: 4-hydroxy-tetrahydrodipicolinate synthase [Omnitrophica WOR_2 bacterium RBG_13_44_8]|nr:MAG: 4-hydroxy-tetrahydrodipicolinate synthase [Omnitrophica WOR_2 bacterium RBG_13_44_8]
MDHFDFGKLITAVITPFNNDFSLNLKAFGQLLDRLRKNGTDSVVISGTTGESPTLTKDEKIKLFEYAVENYKGKLKIIAGTGTYSTDESIELSVIAEKIGADAVMLVTPYYNKPTQDGLYAHFSKIAKSISIPVMLYNVPSRTLQNINADTTVKLSGVDNITAIKEASGNYIQIAEIISRADSRFRVYSGNDSDTFPILCLGGSGVVSVASHILGPQIKEMIEKYFYGDIARSRELHFKLLRASTELFMTTSPIPIKECCNILGYDVGPLRLPLNQATEKEREKLRLMLESYKLI